MQISITCAKAATDLKNVLVFEFSFYVPFGLKDKPNLNFQFEELFWALTYKIR